MCSTSTTQYCAISNNAILFIKARNEFSDAEESSVDSRQIKTSLDPGVYDDKRGYSRNLDSGVYDDKRGYSRNLDRGVYDDKRGYSRTPSTVSIITCVTGKIHIKMPHFMQKTTTPKPV